jgi:putative SOS response-associated peptidase YedK
MCGRYTLTSPAEAARDLGDLLSGAGAEALAALPARYNVAPTQDAPVVVNRPARTIELFRWGLVPHWAADPSGGAKMINARGESVAEKPAFREAFAKRRCLVPADGFFEWRAEGRKKQPLWIRREPRRTICFAGLWARWRGKGGDGVVVDSFTILTTTPNEVVAPYHDRMPVILEPADYERWLCPDPLPAEALLDLIRPSAMADLVVREVSMAASSVANDGPECVAPPAQPRLL